MKVIKEGKENWNETKIHAVCKYCGCVFEGTVKDGDFTLNTDNPRFYSYQCTCPSCGTTIKI